MSLFPDLHDLGFRDFTRYTVSYLTSDKSSWISLPSSVASKLVQQRDSWPVIIELQPAPLSGAPLSAPVFLAWAGATSEFGETVGIPAAVARSLGLDKGSYVTITPLGGVPAATSVSVEPASPDDWEVVELNAERIEQDLLSQTGVASTEQPLLVWVNGQPIPLTVTATAPAAGHVTRLVDGTEISIAPRPRYTKTAQNETAENGSSELSWIVETTLRLLPYKYEQEEEEMEERMPPPLPAVEESNDDFKSVESSEEDENEGNGDFYTPMRDSASKMVENELPKGVWVAHVAAATLQRVGLKNGDWVSLTAPRAGNTTACIMESKFMPVGHISVPDLGRVTMGAEPFDSIKLRKLNGYEKAAILEKAAAAALADSASKTNGSSTPMDAMYSSMSWHAPLSAAFAAAASRGQKLGTAAGGAESALPLVRIPESHRKAAEKVLESVIPVLAVGTRSVLQNWGTPRPGSVLISGPPGSGKSSLLAALTAALSSHPHTQAEVQTVSCRSIHSEQEAEKRISQAIATALSHMPAVIVLEDIDVMCPGAPQGEPHPGEEHIDHGGGVVAWLCELLDGLSAPSEKWARQTSAKGACLASWSAVAVIGTCRDAANVANELREVGRFETVVNLLAPSVESRIQMLEANVKSRGMVAEKKDLESIAASADGFDGADLSVLLDRALNIAVSRQLRAGKERGGVLGGVPLRLTKADLEEAIKGMIPAAFWGSGTRTEVQSGVQGWEDVGGLAKVQEALQEALELPLKYPNLVASAPLRLRTGALLYGPPGCGKTHIVAAAVAAAGVRCITVSGPELLNKYIGASEAAVRDVFRRAAAAAPSVLFFDEFDAIAPRRGHDNTGVTDRVVNQLLTELDGVEGLRGVIVVAATSRPDLIDAALLRPGRLDRLLHCGFPTLEERQAILRALSRRLTLAEDIDLDKIALDTEEFSGADLGAILSDAQLAAAHEVLEASSGKGHAVHAAVVCQRHIQAALASARPSVMGTERQRLAAIYERFENGGSFNEPVEHQYAGKMVSWA